MLQILSRIIGLVCWGEKMARQVYTYNSITELRKHPRFETLSKYPHIVATANLKFAVEECYGEEIANVIDVHSLQKALTKEWNDTATTFEQFMVVGSVIRSMTGLTNSEQLLQEAFLKSRRDVLNSIRSLVEADVFPEDFIASSAEERMFRAIWMKTEAVDLSIGRYRALMERYSSDINSLSEVIKQFRLTDDYIVLHGFYYITALQERLFDLLEQAGKTLIFLGNVDPTVSGVNQIWHKVFSEDNGFPNTSQWVEGMTQRNPASAFGRVFEGDANGSKLDNIRIIKYRNEAEFLSDIKRITEDGYSLFSNDLKKTESVIKEVFPEKFKDRHLLSYPVGQYFYVLHSLWDRNAQALTLSVDDIQKCFSSGWVVRDGKNGRDYTYAFELVKPFFEDCRTIADWKERIQVYQSVSSFFSNLFEAHIPSQNADNYDLHRIMANPFLNLSCFSLRQEDANTVFSLVDQLIEVANGLFGTESEIDIGKHFSKIQEIIKSGYEEAVLFDEEKAIIQELAQRLSNPHIVVSKCLPEDISDAVMMIIGGGILDEDNYEIMASSDEHFVRFMAQIETAPIVAEGKIHLCLCDENRLPGTPSRYSWPLSDTMLKTILSQLDGRRAQYLQDLISVKEDSVLSNRYLFYAALQNQSVELSWIAEENGKTIAESPYLRILNRVFGCEIEQLSSDPSISDSCTSVVPPEFIIHPDLLQIKEMEYDALLCPWKYIYGYLTETFPSYRSDFHYRFVLSAIISAFSKATGISPNTVSEHVLDCFPYLKDVEKRQIRDFYTTSFPVEDSDSLDDVSYSSLRLMPHFATRTMILKAIEQTEQNDGESIPVDLFAHRSESYQVCLYCQYKDTCIRAVREAEEE